jgi:hypothetical protein
MSNSIKETMHRICDTLAANITDFAKFYNTPLNSHTAYGAYMIETITEECVKALQTLFKLKNIDLTESEYLDQYDTESDSAPEANII